MADARNADSLTPRLPRVRVAQDHPTDGGGNLYATMSIDMVKQTIGAWHIGSVFDRSARVQKDWYTGPRSGEMGATVNIAIRWMDWRALRGATGRDDVGSYIAGAAVAGPDSLNMQRVFTWPSRFNAGKPPLSYDPVNSTPAEKAAQKEWLEQSLDNAPVVRLGGNETGLTDKDAAFLDGVRYESRLVRERRKRLYQGDDADRVGRTRAQAAIARDRLRRLRENVPVLQREKIWSAEVVDRTWSAIIAWYQTLSPANRAEPTGDITITKALLVRWLTESASAEDREFFGFSRSATDAVVVTDAINIFFDNVDGGLLAPADGPHFQGGVGPLLCQRVPRGRRGGAARRGGRALGWPREVGCRRHAPEGAGAQPRHRRGGRGPQD